MWASLSHFILRNRITLLVVMLLLTGFFGWQASRIELSYQYAKVLPKDDPAFKAYEAFKQRYGEDGNVLVIGFSGKDSIFKLPVYNAWYDLAEDLRKIKGIKQVLSITRLYNLKNDEENERFDTVRIAPTKPQTQEKLDSIRKVIYRLPFYRGLVLSKDCTATLMALTFNDKDLNSKHRLDIVADVKARAEKFGMDTKLIDPSHNRNNVHFSGMPFIRTEYMRKISSEMKLFLILALLVTAFILWLFFRYFNAVFFSMVVVAVGVIWSLGTIALFGYKITVLSGLIPPLIIVIGLPNCIFLINKYQEELRTHQNKMKALARMVQKVGLSNFLANVTTAIGFGVFYFTNSSLLVEFGVVAAINVMTTYMIALILTPIIFSYLPEPKTKHTRHLNNKFINGMIDLIDRIVHQHRWKVYTIIAIVTGVSIYGMMRIKVVGYVVDDLPRGDRIYTDLHFFEERFNGVLPFEIIVDSKKRDGLFADGAQCLYNIKALQDSIEKFPEFSRPLSVIEVLKFAYQAYKDGKPKAYLMPNIGELDKLRSYSQSVENQDSKFAALVDSSHRYARISYQMKDVGSIRSKELVARILPTVGKLFGDTTKYHVDLTGNSLVFLKSNDYLLHHLFVSLAIAIGLILLIGMVLFRSVAIIVLSKLPALIPLVVTAGMMGFCGIPLKPSTILIFSIAFGISSDGTIYILTEYRHQLKKLSFANAARAVSNAIRETGVSMIYTNVILFAGFAIFMASSFGGTVALGIMLSFTLLVALVTNLLLLPCILLSLEKRVETKAFMLEPLLEIYNEEEDIEADKLKIQPNGPDEYSENE